MLGKKLSEKLLITSPHLHGELQTFLVFSQHPKWELYYTDICHKPIK